MSVSTKIIFLPKNLSALLKKLNGYINSDFTTFGYSLSRKMLCHFLNYLKKGLNHNHSIHFINLQQYQIVTCYAKSKLIKTTQTIFLNLFFKSSDTESEYEKSLDDSQLTLLITPTIKSISFIILNKNLFLQVSVWMKVTKSWMSFEQLIVIHKKFNYQLRQERDKNENIITK